MMLSAWEYHTLSVAPMPSKSQSIVVFIPLVGAVFPKPFWHYMKCERFLIFFFFLKIEKLMVDSSSKNKNITLCITMYLCMGLRKNLLLAWKWIQSGYILYPWLDFFQSHTVSVWKIKHRHKGCDWLRSRKYFGSTSTKKLRLVKISFDTPTYGNSNKDNKSLVIKWCLQHRQWRGRGLGQLPSLSTPGAWDGTTATPVADNGSKNVFCLPCLVVAAPAHRAANVRRPFCQDAAPFQDRHAWVHPRGHLCYRHTSSANCRLDSSLALLCSTLACFHHSHCHPSRQGVRRRCHHPGKAVQAGGVAGQVDPAHTCQVHQGTPCIGGRREAKSIHPEKFMYVGINTSTLGKENCSNTKISLQTKITMRPSCLKTR
jgi:hypothetical protein